MKNQSLKSIPKVPRHKAFTESGTIVHGNNVVLVQSLYDGAEALDPCLIGANLSNFLGRPWLVWVSLVWLHAHENHPPEIDMPGHTSKSLSIMPMKFESPSNFQSSSCSSSCHLSCHIFANFFGLAACMFCVL